MKFLCDCQLCSEYFCTIFVARQASPQEFKTKKTATGSKDSRRKPTRRSSPRPRLFPVKNRSGQGGRVGVPADEVVDRKMSDRVSTNVEKSE